MKKLFALLMTVALMASFCAVFAVSSAAAVDFVEPTYQYDPGDEYGNMPAVFCDGLWMYEYRMSEGGEYKEFQPMGFWVAEVGATHSMGGQYKCYLPYEAAAEDSADPANYCIIRTAGKQMHPGTGADPVLTFVVPASGTIAYELAVGCNADKTNNLAVYLNDKIVWPANSDEMFAFTGTGTGDSFDINIDSLKVNEGDKIRFVVNCGGDKGAKVCVLNKMPLVTYLQASVPIRNFFPPELINTTTTADSCVVSWPAADKAVSYNVYMGDTKVNTEPVTGTEFTITGLESSKSYLGLTVTSVNAEGQESEHSTAVGFRTKKGEATTPASTVTPTTGEPTNSGSNEPVNPTNNTEKTPTASTNTSKKSGGLSTGAIVGIICGIVALAAIVVAVIMILKKKKNSAE